MILDGKWSQTWTANNPKRKVGMGWTQVRCIGSISLLLQKVVKEKNFGSQINTLIKSK